MKRFAFSMWVYNDIREFTPEELDVWVDCGMTVPMLPKTYIRRDDPSILLPWLQRAAERGVEVIVNFEDMGFKDLMKIGREAYLARVKPVYDALGSHPAVHGFYIGDEPYDNAELEASLQCIAINRELAPHLTPYMNYTGNSPYFSGDEFAGLGLDGWMKRSYKTSGVREIAFDEYSQAVNEEGGVTRFFTTLSRMKEAARGAGDADLWGCFLSSGHLMFTPPGESEYRWEINAAAALGLRGVLWFRLYDRDIGFGYYGSPIDEFGTKTEAYYALRRCQRRFLRHFGEIFMRLRHKKTYSVNSSRGVFPPFDGTVRPGIRGITAEHEAIASLFEDGDGREYLALVNCSTHTHSTVAFDCDETRCRLIHLTNNGADESPAGDIEKNVMNVIPGGLHLFRIEETK